jgi:hypothetical protein
LEDSDLIKKDYGPDFQKHLLEQYKLFVGTSLDVTSKRLEANKFHLTLNSVIVGFSGALIVLNQHAAHILLSLVGMVIAVVWRKSIIAYKELNKAKFIVIHQLEAYLPACLFKCEEKHASLSKYHGLTSAEKWYPIIFIVLYLAIIILALVSYLESMNFVLPT